MFEKIPEKSVGSTSPTVNPASRQPNIHLRRTRSIELDKQALRKLSEAYPEINLVLLRLQRELCVDSGDSTEKGYRAEALAKIINEFEQIALDGETLKKEEQK